ncbi:hypothetical protein QNO00_12550 [Arthrobacter sp. zg-Y1219]|uniref:maleylpyruvate isomerase N-terminal domain-containing protein n=1 Tax=Arthrobacter sp. zg-Y1219 TaxID=3049067 RepID=UPI0024C2FE14|nr:maleylpyruvate isomerase N-terminal domain-containing protein [Arthrobacter sp. zg-Y1219]MDK1361089.1 hypothetical protein [Arthrobacter sp. zg-Y1219]
MTVQLPDPVLDKAPSNEEMLQAYLDGAARLIALARDAGDAKADTIVPASPAWSVRNVVAHLTSVASISVNQLGWGDDVQATIDREVADRADSTVDSITKEWEALLGPLASMFAGHPSGPLVVDVVTHEHDVRAALGPEYQDHSAGLEEALSAMVGWVRYLGLVGEPGLLLKTPTSQALFGGPEIGCEVELPSDWELFRLLGVRRSEEQLMAYPATGNKSLLLAVTSRYPLPVAPLID